MNSKKFNTYIDSPVAEYWKELCLKEGTLKHFERGEHFFREGEVAKYIGYIEQGTLKYVACNEKGDESVMGFEFTGELVADFPFSIRGMNSRLAVVAESPCDIWCVPTAILRERLATDERLQQMVMEATEAVFNTVYDRYKDLYTKTPQQRYNELISLHPDLFSLYSLRDIASFLKVTPTHLSRLRRNIEL